MGDFRIYNLALGRQNNFFARTDNVFSQSDTTPDVTNGIVWFSNNTSNTTITGFDLSSTSQAGNNAGNFEGKVIRVFFLDGSTRLANAAPLYLATSDGLQGANNNIELLYHNSGWYELSRSYVNSGYLNVTSAGLNTNATLASLGTGVVNVIGNVRLLNLTAESTTPVVLRRAINGEQGQMLTLIANGGSDALIIVNTAANDTFATTSTAAGATQFRLASSGAITFVKSGAQWYEVRAIGSTTGGNLQ